jgi:hypothetical protein
MAHKKNDSNDSSSESICGYDGPKAPNRQGVRVKQKRQRQQGRGGEHKAAQTKDRIRSSEAKGIKKKRTIEGTLKSQAC